MTSVPSVPMISASGTLDAVLTLRTPLGASTLSPCQLPCETPAFGARESSRRIGHGASVRGVAASDLSNPVLEASDLPPEAVALVFELGNALAEAVVLRCGFGSDRRVDHASGDLTLTGAIRAHSLGVRLPLPWSSRPLSAVVHERNVHSGRPGSPPDLAWSCPGSTARVRACQRSEKNEQGVLSTACEPVDLVVVLARTLQISIVETLPSLTLIALATSVIATAMRTRPLPAPNLRRTGTASLAACRRHGRRLVGTTLTVSLTLLVTKAVPTVGSIAIELG